MHNGRRKKPKRLTLAHKVLEVVPLNIVRKVSDVDPTVLLRAVTKTLHHSVLCCSSVFR